MAVLKHIASRNRCYSDSINYLTYQHNEFTNTPILDENGMMIDCEDVHRHYFHPNAKDNG